MSIQSVKFTNFNTERKALTKSISGSVSALNAGITTAIKQQAYMHKNPDGNGADELISVVSDDIDLIEVALAEVNEKAADLLAVRAGTMTVDESLAKYTAINLEEYSNELL